MAVASSSSSSTTAADRDVEAQRQEAPIAPKTSHWSVLLDQAGVDDAVLNHKYPGNGTVESPYLVDFLPSDPRNPVTFSKTFKWAITLIAAMSTLAVSFASSAYSGGVFEIMMDFGASTEVVILGVSMFVLGFAIGPLIWAPLSEMYGRQHLFFFTYMALTAFNAGAAGAPSMAALIVLRFFAGAFGSSPLTNAGGVIADMFSANERGIATSIFAMAPFLGPALGPIAGGFLGEAEGWRWVEGLTAIFTGVLWIINSLVYPETYAPVLLRKRAIALSEKTGKVYISKLDEGKPKKSVGSQMKVAMSRPWILLFREPIVLLTAIYMAIIYGTLYLCFAAFPIVFQQGRGWKPGIGGLAFIGIAVGMTVATVGSIFDNGRYQRAAKKAGGMAPPEARLPPALVGSILLPVGLFWFAWTNGNSVHWVVPIIGSGFFAAGIVLVFLSLMNYLVDSYVIFAASVLAANSVLRSLFGAIFPLFTTYMYQDLGNHWASSIPAFLALACVPFPFLFYKYGARIRMKCKFAAEAAHVLEMMRTKHTQITEEEAVHEADDKERERRESTALEKQATNAQQTSS
ncbi:multidrug resistance protein [Purpureocillium lilacinum]|uniref:Multidrug resistance protein n=1 Tax=Purpureocillium lilacinum TaxID=33203 RepID=A0A179H3J2_PURLI|nr:multidrug resistance protein [Purpureocillium lilacinum]